MNRSQSKIRHIRESNILLEQRKFRLMEDAQKTSMKFIGSTPSSDNSWDRGGGFWNIYTNSDGNISDVMNYWDGGSGPSKIKYLFATDPIGYEGDPIERETKISFDYYTTVKAGDALNVSFNAKSSNGDNVTSETYSKGPVESETIYGGKFTLMNLPENSTITISANGDNVNKLVIKTKEK